MIRESNNYLENIVDDVEDIERERCAYYIASRIQRKNELIQGRGTEGTRSFEKVGCYSCNGYNIKCDSYLGLENL